MRFFLVKWPKISSEVRRAVLKSIIIAPHTITAVIARTRHYSREACFLIFLRDTKEEIRKEAYSVLQRRVDIHDLKLEQRAFLVREGLGDRYVCAWLNILIC